ncbi:helix-turn-helix transcriptional regulator [Robiginitomaculum antarcticum]|uniref:helix-turn-helix transcriptional regulator n=1 Tax=Robiginitomaculum antarcticum TaxID=437507 RepID=UPI000376F9D5|nr:helix-turn-helix transcriptional regulator [Robiginitomaculum antarcticum]
MARKFGDILRAARLEHALSQAQLAGLCDVSQPTIASWERGAHAPRRAAVIKLASALGLTPSSFFEDGPPPARPLNTLPLMQVPVLDWPERFAALATSPIRRYLPIGVDAARPIALPLADIQMNALAPLGSLTVIDIGSATLKDGDVALIAQTGGVPILRRISGGGSVVETAPLRGPSISSPIGAHTIRGRAVMMVSEL